MTAQRKRMLVAAGLIALAALAYLWWRSRGQGSSSGTQPFSTGEATDQGGVPVTGSSDSGGGGAVGGTPQDTSAQDLLSALSGENQAVLNSLLGSTQGLYSLLGRSYGSTSMFDPSGQPLQLAPTPAPAPKPTPSAPLTTLAPTSYAGFTAQAVQGGTVYTPTTATATAINAAPNALRTIGSDAAQSIAPAPTRTTTTTTTKKQPTTFLATHAAPR